MEQFIWALAISTHLGLEGDYNSIHPHVRFVEDGVVAGAYYNSEERVSFYGGYRFEKNDFGIELGVVNAYPALGGIIPYTRGTYDFNENTRAFVAPGGEVRNGNTNIGVVIGLEILLK